MSDPVRLTPGRYVQIVATDGGATKLREADDLYTAVALDVAEQDRLTLDPDLAADGYQLLVTVGTGRRYFARVRRARPVIHHQRWKADVYVLDLFHVDTGVVKRPRRIPAAVATLGAPVEGMRAVTRVDMHTPALAAA